MKSKFSHRKFVTLFFLARDGYSTSTINLSVCIFLWNILSSECYLCREDGLEMLNHSVHHISTFTQTTADRSCFAYLQKRRHANKVLQRNCKVRSVYIYLASSIVSYAGEQTTQWVFRVPVEPWGSGRSLTELQIGKMHRLTRGRPT